MRLCDFPILAFDTYGTLIDWETGIWDTLQPLCAPSRFSVRLIDFLFALIGSPHQDDSQDRILLGMS